MEEGTYARLRLSLTFNPDDLLKSTNSAVMNYGVTGTFLERRAGPVANITLP